MPDAEEVYHPCSSIVGTHNITRWAADLDQVGGPFASCSSCPLTPVRPALPRVVGRAPRRRTSPVTAGVITPYLEVLGQPYTEREAELTLAVLTP